MQPTPSDDAAEFEEALAGPADDAVYVLRLFVTGMTTRSAHAVAAIKAVCEQYLAGRYDLEVIDIYQQPALAREEQIVAVPTLVKRQPPPPRRIVGDLSNFNRLLAGLNLSVKG